MTPLQRSMRDLIAKHRAGGYWLMFCVIFTGITLLREALHLCGVFPASSGPTVLGRIGLAVFGALFSLIHAMQPTAGRRKPHFLMTKTQSFQSTLGSASGG
jgi:hypothetical protein